MCYYGIQEGKMTIRVYAIYTVFLSFIFQLFVIPYMYLIYIQETLMSTIILKFCFPPVQCNKKYVPMYYDVIFMK